MLQYIQRHLDGFVLHCTFVHMPDATEGPRIYIHVGPVFWGSTILHTRYQIKEHLDVFSS